MAHATAGETGAAAQVRKMGQRIDSIRGLRYSNARA
jgi:hypothetical protein